MKKVNIAKKFRCAALCGAAGMMLVMPASGVCAGSEAAGGPIDENTAQQIALEDAGAQESDAERLRVKKDFDDGEDVLEVEFYYQSSEYEYTLRQSDGMILEWQVEGRNVGDAAVELTLAPGGESEKKTSGDADSAGQASEGAAGVIAGDGTQLVGIEKAKEIVAADASDPDELTFSKLHFEYNGRRYEYEIECYAGYTEYEYSLDAETGDIFHLEWDD